MAEHDLSQIFAYVEEEASRTVANRILKRIVHSATLLMQNPWLGHPSESTDGVHELQVAKLPYCLPGPVIEDTGWRFCGFSIRRGRGRWIGARRDIRF